MVNVKREQTKVRTYAEGEIMTTPLPLRELPAHRPTPRSIGSSSAVVAHSSLDRPNDTDRVLRCRRGQAVAALLSTLVARIVCSLLEVRTVAGLRILWAWVLKRPEIQFHLLSGSVV